jgi:lipoate-protein ligase B
MEYCRGWAWQQILLTQRLYARKNPQANSNANHDVDSILLLEHAPVYTLGRGASEEHLLFLNNSSSNNNNNNDDCHAIRQKLSRKYRGHDSARLVLNDRRALEDMLQQYSIQETIEKLVSPPADADAAASPVRAPNGVPIYRVDRGGEVTFHGPSQLVVYPLLDLKRPPLQADLHWFLRQLEEAVIQTLQHYGMEGTRDEINSGKT